MRDILNFVGESVCDRPCPRVCMYVSAWYRGIRFSVSVNNSNNNNNNNNYIPNQDS